MATLETLNDGETGASIRGKINSNFTAVNADLSTLDANKLESTDIATINGNAITAGGNLVIPSLTDGDKGDITVSSSGTVWTVDNDAITYAKMQNMTGDRILGRISGVSGDIGELTGTQATTLLSQFSTSAQGVVPATTSATGKFLTDGGWGYGNFLYKSVTTVSKSNYTGAGSAAYSTTIPGGVIASGKGIKIVIDYYTQVLGFNDSRDDNVIRVDLGGTTINSLFGIASRASTLSGYLRTFEMIILGTGTATQDVSMILKGISTPYQASKTIDTSSDVTLAIYAGFEYASTSVKTDFYTITVQSI